MRGAVQGIEQGIRVLDMALGESASAVSGDGYAVGSLNGMGDGPGFRKIRRELDVKEFGVNAIVMPEGISSGFHFHERQEELYFVHSGEIEIEFGDGSKHRLGPGGMARVDAARTARSKTSAPATPST
ncbi:MAG: cupin domain-containing protein [Solirubrobacterales bacterium]